MLRGQPRKIAARQPFHLVMRLRTLPVALLLLLLAAGPARAGVTTDKPTYDVVVEQNVVVPMTDGTRLVADVYRPAPKSDGQRFPCLFEQTPYRKEMRAEEAAGFFPTRGFVYMELDARGTGGSEGEYDGVFLPQEQEDGYDAIEWLATKYPHCNGRVGMWGGSYSGINQYLTATSPKGKPPHLLTIAPQRAFSDLYRDIVYTGGILTGSFGAIWAAGTTGYNTIGADPRSGPDPELAVRAPVEHLQNDPMFARYLNEPFDSALYRDSSVIYRLRRLRLPVLHLAGLYDAFTRGQLQAIGRLLELQRAGKVRGPNYAIVGPWNHGGTHFLDHPPFDQRILEWYRHWLDGSPRPAWFRKPPVTFCEMQEARDGKCRWRRSAAWPPARSSATRLFLAAGGRLAARAPAGSAPIGSWEWNPTAGTGEAGFSKWDNAAGPPQRDADQAAEDEFKGLTFSTPPLARDLVVNGPIMLSLKATTEPLAGDGSGPDIGDLVEELGQAGAARVLPPYHDTDFVVKLAEVAPDGTSTLIQSGFLRASHRLLDPRRTRRAGRAVTEPVPWHDQQHLAPPPVGKPVRYEIEVWPIAKRFRRGHQLRIALYSADTPGHFTVLKPARNTVLAGSYLLLTTAR